MLHADNHACGGSAAAMGVLFCLCCHACCIVSVPHACLLPPPHRLFCILGIYMYLSWWREVGLAPGADAAHWQRYLSGCYLLFIVWHSYCIVSVPHARLLPPPHRLFCILNIYIYLSWWSEVGVAPGSNVACCQRCWWWVSFFLFIVSEGGMPVASCL